ncbi:acetylgalactosaminyl-O-glycosyl-glycoprotein beta-1,3-N-acetylglucosaminyltransferase [Tupaia chinensis]|uniref:acetylgalactosaminyl-O-glycosyl-glycoprotein beta-1,3-N-acetylglucosaminyltransferase n=1 Tax=Tupaia chinensis TaxID=246437 RepID=UPI0003C8DE2E|nr:acetylgalactosaminyl-O-glycosyl-glycoprotein beta-1,3-N-acetylglucosaminyltransferase [Tupaia chinensis]
MAFPCCKPMRPKTLPMLLVGVSFMALHLWSNQAPRPQQKQEVTLEPASAAEQPSALTPGSPCVANASAHTTAGFEHLPERIQDYLRYRHCRHFPLLWDVPAKCAGRHGVFLLLAVKSSPANYERREFIRRTWGQERTYGGRDGRRLFVHTANIIRFLEAQPPDRHLFTGQLMDGSVPIRDSRSKYFVPPQLFPGPAYPVYCSGGGFLLSRHTVRALHAAKKKLFPIDDAYMGMCLQRAGLAPSGHQGIRPFGVQLPGAQHPSFDPCIYRELLLVHRFAPYELLLMWKALHSPALRCGQGRPSS